MTSFIAEGDQFLREQQGLLGQYGTYAEEVDDKKVERVRIPIDRAIELMSSQSK
jgi:hypothetical protein